MKPLVILLLSLCAPFLKGCEKWDVREVAEHGFYFESKDYSVNYYFYYNGIADADIREENGDGVHPRYAWRITDSGLLVILRGHEPPATLRKINVTGSRYQVEENGHPLEYRRYPLVSTKSEKERAWMPDPKDVEALRQALIQAVPLGYKVSPYAELGDYKGIAIYYDPSNAEPKLSTDPQIIITFCPRLEVAERQRLHAEYKSAFREFNPLPSAERQKKMDEFRKNMPTFPDAYFRSLGICELPPKPRDMASCYQVKLTPKEEEDFQLIDAAILRLITVYEEVPNQSSEQNRKASRLNNQP